MKKIILLIALFVLIIPFKVNAVNIVDGDLIRVANAFDVYIVKIIGAKKFKRLILNPEIFTQYGHLKWENIKDVSSLELDEYVISDLVRASGDDKIYKLYPNNDTGEKRWVKTASDFIGLGYDWDSVYTINNFERDFYVAGSDLEYTKAPETPSQPLTPSRNPITIKVPSDYSTIQAAINAAINGDTISVSAGTYNENIIIDKSIKLIGESVGNTIIDGKGKDNAINITQGTGVLVKKITAKSQDKYGIYCQGENLITVILKNNFIIDSGWGIVAENNCQITALNNLIYNNRNSSNIDGAGVFVKNNFSYGITSEIRNNLIDDNYHGIWGEHANLKVINNIITSNVGGTGPISSSGIYHSGDGVSNDTFNDVWGNGVNYNGNASAGDGSITADPKFADSDHRDYKLKTAVSSVNNSLCIDHGHPNFEYNDGMLLTTNNYRNDLGAYGGPDNISWYTDK